MVTLLTSTANTKLTMPAMPPAPPTPLMTSERERFSPPTHLSRSLVTTFFLPASFLDGRTGQIIGVPTLASPRCCEPSRWKERSSLGIVCNEQRPRPGTYKYQYIPPLHSTRHARSFTVPPWSETKRETDQTKGRRRPRSLRTSSSAGPRSKRGVGVVEGVGGMQEMVPPPFRFGVVEADVFRSAQPTLKNYRFLSR